MTSKQFICTSELAKRLQVPKQTVYHWVHRREIPYLKVGRHLRFDYEDVLNHFRVSTSSRITSPASSFSKHGSLTIEEMTLADPSQKED